MGTEPAAVESFIQAFFRSPNHLSPSHRGLAPFIDLIRAGKPTALPYKTETGTRWYGFALDETLATENRQMLTAFVGPSHGDMSGPAAQLDGSDPIESALAAIAVGPVVRFSALDTRPKSQFPTALELYRETLATRPTFDDVARRPRHRVLSELELALQVSNAPRAEELIDELTALGAYSATDLAFLRVRQFEAQHDWEGLLNYSQLPQILRLRRLPRPVSGGIARAIDAVHFAPHRLAWFAGDPNAAAGAVASFEEIDPGQITVLRFDPDGSCEELRTGRLLYDLTQNGGQKSAEIAADAEDRDLCHWLEAIAGVVDQEPSAPPTEDEKPSADHALRSGDYRAALELCLEGPPAGPAIVTGMRAALNVGTLEAAEKVLRWAGSRPQVLEAARGDKSLLPVEAALRKLCPDDEDNGAVGCWAEWFERLSHPIFRAEAHAILEHCNEWGAEELLDDRANRLLAAIVGTSNDERLAEVALAGVARLTPLLVTHAETPEVPRVAGACLDLLLYFVGPGETSDDLSVDLLALELAGDQVDEVLDQRLSDFVDRWSRVPSPRRVDWALAVVDLTIDFGGSSKPVRDFLASALAEISKWPERLEPSQTATLQQLGAELGLSDSVGQIVQPVLEETAAESTVDPLMFLEGKKLGIYTLFPGVAQRVASIVSSRCPGADVVANDDHVATPGLRSLAESADYMVVALGSAQHAATDAIVGIRGRDRVVRAMGRGSSGMLRALEERLAMGELELAA